MIKQKDMTFRVNREFFSDLIELCDQCVEEVQAGTVSAATREALAKVLSWTPLIATEKPNPLEAS